jgi:hypothetical protein
MSGDTLHHKMRWNVPKSTPMKTRHRTGRRPITTLKLLKWQSDGRAKFDLLRQRMPHAA